MCNNCIEYKTAYQPLVSLTSVQRSIARHQRVFIGSTLCLFCSLHCLRPVGRTSEGPLVTCLAPEWPVSHVSISRQDGSPS